MERSVSNSVLEGKSAEMTPEELGLLLGHVTVSAVARSVDPRTGQRSVYGGHTLAGIVRAAIALGVDPERDRVSIEAGIGQGGQGFYVVDEVEGGIKELREVCR